MNAAELKALFDAEHVDPDSYSCGGGTPSDAYVLERAPSLAPHCPLGQIALAACL